MSEHTVDVITTEVYGQNLQVRLNGHCLFSLHQPLHDRFHLMLDKVDGSHILRIRQTCHRSTRLFESDSFLIASHVMNATADALGRMAKREECSRGKKSAGKWIWGISGITLMAGLSAFWIYIAPSVRPVTEPQPTAIIQNRIAPPASVNMQQQRRPVASPSPQEVAEARQILANRLKNAAEKKDYTISLSSGHPRTLYLFADPNCNNCRIFEPTVQALSRHYNMEIFPVTLVGRARTAEQIVAILCSPDDKRGAMWRRVMDAGSDMLNSTTTFSPQQSSCETGKAALARNDQAFELYRLPGTPTVITDDGRLVPLQAMTSLPVLQAFLNNSQQG